MYNLLYFDEPPSTYKSAGKFKTIEDTLDWLNGHTVGRYTVYANNGCEHSVRVDQWVISDAVGNQIDLIVDSGKFTLGGGHEV